MLILQALAFVVGLATLFATSIVLLPAVQLRPFAGDATALLVSIGILVFAGGYFLFAVKGYRIVRSVLLRWWAGSLVLFQVLGGGAMIWLLPVPAVPAVMGPLLCFSIFLFISFVWPGTRNRKYRPLRKRERTEDSVPRK